MDMFNILKDVIFAICMVTRLLSVGLNSEMEGLVSYTFNKLKHIPIYCREINGPKRKIDANKEKMQNIWVKKSNGNLLEKTKDRSAPIVGVDPYFKN